MPSNLTDLYRKWASGLSDAEAKGRVSEAQSPVAEFPMRYVWHTGPWYDIFQLQIERVQRDIRRAKAEGKLLIYLSCPISSRGGGYSLTNVDVALHIERALLERWGEGFWILNPAQYQLELKAGTGLMNEHADYLALDLDRLVKIDKPFGGDYMRMWTTALVSNGLAVADRPVKPGLANTGQYFDAFYFIGPRDVQSFFLTEGTTMTAGIQAYFARKFATNSDFRAQFSDGARPDLWTFQRQDFLRYYGLRASANFSLGSHDEWLIFHNLNALRRSRTSDPEHFLADGDVGEQLAGFFDGGQIDPASSEASLSRGYSC